MSRIRRRFRIVGMHIHVIPELEDAIRLGKVGDLIPGLIGGGDWVPLELVPDSRNTNDPNAVRVIVPASATGAQELMLGYVPRNQAQEISTLIKDCKEQGKFLGAGLSGQRISMPAAGVVWSAELETTLPIQGSVLKESRRDASDIEDLFENQIFQGGGQAIGASPRPRRGKVRHVWI